MKVSSSFKVHGLLWREIGSLSRYIVPPLPRYETEQSSNLSAVLSSLNKENNDSSSSANPLFEYKGSMGRITIVGGSAEYTGTKIHSTAMKIITVHYNNTTGAPYYAAQSALKFGADLCSGKSFANNMEQLLALAIGILSLIV